MFESDNETSDNEESYSELVIIIIIRKKFKY